MQGGTEARKQAKRRDISGASRSPPFLVSCLPGGWSGSAAGENIHIGEHARGLDFERLLDFLVVLLREFPGAMLKAKVAEIFIDRIAPLEELVEFRAMRRGVRGFPPDAEDEDHGRHGQQGARYGDVNVTH